MKSVEARLDEVIGATDEYVKAYASRNWSIIAAARDGATVAQIAEAARMSPSAISQIIGEPDHEGPGE